MGGEVTKETEEMIRRLVRVNSRDMTSCEKRCYDLLIKMEKEINWDSLLKVKSATFLVEEENEQWENPYFDAT